MSLTDENEEKTLPIPKLEMYVFCAGLILTGATISTILWMFANPGC